MLRVLGERGLLGQAAAVVFARPVASDFEDDPGAGGRAAHRDAVAEQVLRAMGEYAAGIRHTGVDHAVAGAAEPPGPEELRAVVDAVLAGVFDGDLGVALERAAAFCRVVAAGRAEVSDGEPAARRAAPRGQTATPPALPMLLFSRELNVANAALRITRRGRLAAFHARQSLALLLFLVLVTAGWYVIFWLTSFVPYLAIVGLSLFSLVIAAYVFALYAWIRGMSNALKARMTAAGIKNPHHERPERANPFREYRLFPVWKLTRRLGLSKYADRRAPLSEYPLPTSRVVLKLKQHIGAPAAPVVSRGDPVERGDEVGRVGSTGRSTGNHIHYEVRLNKRAVDPENYLGN